ncbi:MAG: exodeoxyribonuclease VII small subunit [Chitinispirillaceae bacterium]|nr:exodeoxyribonuclease VII small subunit [Chitinispirillaceae bacterium]
MTGKSKSTQHASPPGSPSFENALSDLEATIEKLEDPELTLDTSLDLFEKGVSLIRICDDHLKKAQGRVTELIKGENGELVEKLLGTSLDAFTARDGGQDE